MIKKELDVEFLLFEELSKLREVQEKMKLRTELLIKLAWASIALGVLSLILLVGILARLS